MERNYFYFLEYAENVIDIREQFPLLPLEDTLLIAEELGIEHPKNPENGEFIVMTTDFFITIRDSNEEYYVARTIKASDELLNRRILEKFEIERVYWQRRGINWGIVTDREIDKVVANNISFVHGYVDIRNIDSFKEIESIELQDIIYEFIKRIVDSEKTMRSICNQFDKEMNLEKGSGLSIFKYVVINKIIEIDMTKKLDVNKIIPIINIKGESVEKVGAI